MTFTFPAWKLGDKYVVATEELYMGELLLASHADLGDKDQTVRIYEPPVESPKTGDPGILAYTVTGVMSLLGMAWWPRKRDV